MLQRVYQRLHGLQQQRRHAFAADLFQALHIQGEAAVGNAIVDRHRQRIMGALLRVDMLYLAQDIVLRMGLVAQHVAAAGIAVVEHGVEQRQRRVHRTATLGQRQRRMLVMEQARQGLLGVVQGLRHGGAATPQADRQGVEEHAQHAVHADAGMHAAEQYRAEHHLVAAAAARQQQRVGQMEQAGRGDAMATRLGAYAVGERGGQLLAEVLQTLQIAHRGEHPERRGGRLDVAQHLGEEGLVLLRGDARQGVGDEVAERQRCRQLVLLSGQMRAHLFDEQFQGGVVHRQVMVLQAE